jgi:hypothetical protein
MQLTSSMCLARSFGSTLPFTPIRVREKRMNYSIDGGNGSQIAEAL